MTSTAQPAVMTLAEDALLLSVVYSSVATVPFGDADLAALLAVSRANNAPRGLTGLLLCRDGQFMQVLEGPEPAVRSALASIAADPRHSGIWTLDEEVVEQRRFASWAMGYRALSEEDLASAPSWFGSEESARPPGGSRAGELLAWFRSR